MDSSHSSGIPFPENECSTNSASVKMDGGEDADM